MHGWVILPIPCLWGRIPFTVLKDSTQHLTHPLFPSSPTISRIFSRWQKTALKDNKYHWVWILLFSSHSSSWTRYVCERTKCDDGMFPNTALWVGTQIYGFDYMDAFTPHLRFLPAITVSFGTKSLLLWNSEHSDTKEKWLFGWISSSRKLQRPSFNR